MSLHRICSFPKAVIPSGCSIWIYFSRSPWRNVVLTSKFSISKSRLVARPKTTCIDGHFTTGENITSKNCYFHCRMLQDIPKYWRPVRIEHFGTTATWNFLLVWGKNWKKLPTGKFFLSLLSFQQAKNHLGWTFSD